MRLSNSTLYKSKRKDSTFITKKKKNKVFLIKEIKVSEADAKKKDQMQKYRSTHPGVKPLTYLSKYGLSKYVLFYVLKTERIFP